MDFFLTFFLKNKTSCVPCITLIFVTLSKNIDHSDRPREDYYIYHFSFICVTCILELYNTNNESNESNVIILVECKFRERYLYFNKLTQQGTWKYSNCVEF